ncbi:MAG: DMT family transporter [Steroidobacteraceae bacterium]|jgi:drug/metabolite transporter (DMT)-like permease|nr:DMT family transporter [Steroidobacteraceae bacterium]
MDHADGPRDSHAGVYVRLALVPVIWGGTFVAGKLLALELPASVGALMRFIVASVALLATCLLVERRLQWPTRRQFLAMLGLGATGVLAYNLLFLGALALLPASRTSLIVALNPAITIAAAAMVFGERLSARRWLGVGVALAGVWIVVTRGEPGALFTGAVGAGELMMFAAICAWAAYTLIGRGMLAGISPLAATTWSTLLGTAMLASVAAPKLGAVEWLAISPAAALSVLYLGLLGTAVAFVWYLRAVQVLGPARTVIFNNLVPVFGATFGVLLLGEPLSASMLVGGAVAVAGVMLVTRG